MNPSGLKGKTPQPSIKSGVSDPILGRRSLPGHGLPPTNDGALSHVVRAEQMQGLTPTLKTASANIILDGETVMDKNSLFVFFDKVAAAAYTGSQPTAFTGAVAPSAGSVSQPRAALTPANTFTGANTSTKSTSSLPNAAAMPAAVANTSSAGSAVSATPRPSLPSQSIPASGGTSSRLSQTMKMSPIGKK